jgi:CTP:molybdopterin cytidylyltransferase MocA
MRESGTSPGERPADVTVDPRVGAGPQVAGLVLAAGGGRRYGGPKALVRLDGALLVERAVATLRGAGCAPVAVVLGAAAAEVRRTARFTAAARGAASVPAGGVERSEQLILVDNPDWATGMGSSLRVGLAALRPTTAQATVVLLVDTPGVTVPAVARLVDRAAAPSPDRVLARASYDGVPGHPVLLGRAHWAGVAAAAVGDEGARPYLRRHADAVMSVPCEDVADGTDLDLPPG